MSNPKPFLPSPRRRAREFAVQALYQAQLNSNRSNPEIAQQVYDEINKLKNEILEGLRADLEELRENENVGQEEIQSLENDFHTTLQRLDSVQETATELFRSIFFGAQNQKDALLDLIRPHLDRDENSINPIERAVLLMAAYELKEMPQTPYPVIINEAIEVTKTFGGTDSHRFINGILDKLAVQLRPNDPKRN